MPDNRERIVQTATRMIRSGGYNAFSFREIADAVGIKSSSVHHYFRRKEDLAAEVAQRYTESFLVTLGDPEAIAGDAQSVIAHIGDAYIEAFRVSGMACLCGILSHEAPALPPPVIREVEAFIEHIVGWIETAYSEESDTLNISKTHFAQSIYSALTGAMAVATLKQDIGWIEAVRDQLSRLYA